MKKIVMLALIFSLCSALLGCAKTEPQSVRRQPAAATHSHSSRETTEDLDAKFAPIIKEIDEYLEDLDFVKAINVALYNMNHYPEYPAFADKHKEALLAYEAYVETQLQKCIESGNYPGAIEKLNSFIEEDGEREFLIDRKDTLIREYKGYAYNTALTLAYDEKYTEALNLVHESLKYFESKKVEDLVPILESYIPVAVGDMEIFTSSNTDVQIGTNEEDNYGNVHENYFYCVVDATTQKGYVTYLTNYKYTQIYGTVGCPKGIQNEEEVCVYFTIIGKTENGEDVVLWKEMFNESVKPKDFHIDISGYERITLHWYSSEWNLFHFTKEYMATLYDGYFVPVPQELPELEDVAN